MGINLITFYNSTVTPPDDALIYEKALPGSGMIYGGTVTIKNANTLHVAAGHGALCGRKFTIEETDVTVVLTSSGTLNGRLYIHMDLSDTDEPISFQVERAATLTPVIQQDNVNINDGIYEINLATFSISTSTVSNLVNVAPFIDDEVLETIIAPVELTSTASRNYGVGAHLIYKKVLYRVTSAITTGGTITPGSNVTVSNAIVNQIEDLNSSVATINNNKANQTVIATRQANLTASRAYAVGDQFIYNNILYKATAAIASGGAITIGGNATAADNIVSQISNRIKLLWTNPNPTSAMVVQNLALSDDISNYKLLLIIFKPEYANGQAYSSAIMSVSVGELTLSGFAISYSTTGTAGLMMYRRMNVIGTNQISVNRGWFTECNTHPSEYTGACVPQYIYGIK